MIGSMARKNPGVVRIYRAERQNNRTEVLPIDPQAADDALLGLLKTPGGDRIFEELAGHGKLDT